MRRLSYFASICISLPRRDSVFCSSSMCRTRTVSAASQRQSEIDMPYAPVCGLGEPHAARTSVSERTMSLFASRRLPVSVQPHGQLTDREFRWDENLRQLIPNVGVDVDLAARSPTTVQYRINAVVVRSEYLIREASSFFILSFLSLILYLRAHHVSPGNGRLQT